VLAGSTPVDQSRSGQRTSLPTVCALRAPPRRSAVRPGEHGSPLALNRRTANPPVLRPGRRRPVARDKRLPRRHTPAALGYRLGGDGHCSPRASATLKTGPLAAPMESSTGGWFFPVGARTRRARANLYSTTLDRRGTCAGPRPTDGFYARNPPPTDRVAASHSSYHGGPADISGASGKAWGRRRRWPRQERLDIKLKTRPAARGAPRGGDTRPPKPPRRRLDCDRRETGQCQQAAFVSRWRGSPALALTNSTAGPCRALCRFETGRGRARCPAFLGTTGKFAESPTAGASLV